MSRLPELMLCLLLASGTALAEEAKPVTANAAAETAPAAISPLLEKSGIGSYVDLLPTVVLPSMFQNSGGMMSPITQEKAKAAFTKAYDAGKIKQLIADKLKNSLRPEEIKSLCTWFDSPLGKRIIQLEKTAATPEAAKAIGTCPPAEGARAALIQRLDKALKSTEMTMTIGEKAGMAMMKASIPPEMTTQINPEMLANMVRAGMERNRPMMEKQNLATLNYSFQSLSEDELKQYLAFAETGEAGKLHEATSSVLASELGTAFGAVGGVMATEGGPMGRGAPRPPPQAPAMPPQKPTGAKPSTF